MNHQQVTKQQLWQQLQAHAQLLSKTSIKELFLINNQRYADFSLQLNGMLFDYSKNLIDQETIKSLIELAKINHLPEQISNLMAGQPVNFTENLPALHPLVRSLCLGKKRETGKEEKLILNSYQKMIQLTQALHANQWRGVTDKPFTDIVNLGIGGSYLGPQLGLQALQHFKIAKQNFHHIASVDGVALDRIMENCNPQTTLIIISSKSFQTQETLTNAHILKQWLQSALGPGANKHCLAITAKPELAKAFGILEENILAINAGIGGRFSVWSAMGFPLMLSIGVKHFQEFLQGAYETDQHFSSAAFEENIPVLMALLSIWYNNFFHCQTRAILPYDELLSYLPSFIQQLAMESNGKRCNVENILVDYATAPIIWGEIGALGQHSFFQLLHQGTHIVPADFIFTLCPQHSYLQEHQRMLAHGLKQISLLVEGGGETACNLASTVAYPTQSNQLACHYFATGNKPCNILIFPHMTPSYLGMLIALYEHKTFAESVIWGLNAFDQMGVDMGKKQPDINLDSLTDENIPISIRDLVNYCNQRQRK